MSSNTSNKLEMFELDVLKKWSKCDHWNVLFDSDVHGNGCLNSLTNAVFGKKNLYFITSDFKKNVFGGYVSSTINTLYDYIYDANAFVFSLLRNGVVKNKKYDIIGGTEEYFAFRLFDNNLENEKLYGFSCDATISIIGSKNSTCCQCSYMYGVSKPLTESEKFDIERIIVIQMS